MSIYNYFSDYLLPLIRNKNILKLQLWYMLTWLDWNPETFCTFFTKKESTLNYKIKNLHEQAPFCRNVLSTSACVLPKNGRVCNQPLARPIKCRLQNSPSASIFKVLRSKLVKMFFKCQTAWIRLRRRVTRRLIRIQAVCIWDYSCEWRPKG